VPSGATKASEARGPVEATGRGRRATELGRPYVLLSAAMSADGYIDDSSDRRLVLSGPEDLDQVDAIRADSDAILVGANTVRRDNPGLRVRSAARRAERERRGRPPGPARVTLTEGGGLDPAARFFAADDGVDRLVYAPGAVAGVIRERLGGAATVIGAAESLSLAWVLADLAGRGIARLMVEGGSEVLGQFLAAGLADELRLAVAPVFVADSGAPRLVAAPPGESASAGWPPTLQLAEVGQAGRMAVLRYRLITPET
jgi:5-amino-6-(5-phosphoribosylamino)uracil reductase